MTAEKDTATLEYCRHELFLPQGRRIIKVSECLLQYLTTLILLH